jgi:hypothetical protein
VRVTTGSLIRAPGFDTRASGWDVATQTGYLRDPVSAPARGCVELSQVDESVGGCERENLGGCIDAGNRYRSAIGPIFCADNPFLPLIGPLSLTICCNDCHLLRVERMQARG